MWASPRSYFDSAQHERPGPGEGRHKTCPYEGEEHGPGEGITLTPSRDSGQALAFSRRRRGDMTLAQISRGASERQ